jgi:hypothetical protein
MYKNSSRNHFNIYHFQPAKSVFNWMKSVNEWKTLFIKDASHITKSWFQQGAVHESFTCIAYIYKKNWQLYKTHNYMNKQIMILANTRPLFNMCTCHRHKKIDKVKDQILQIWQSNLSTWMRWDSDILFQYGPWLLWRPKHQKRVIENWCCACTRGQLRNKTCRLKTWHRKRVPLCFTRRFLQNKEYTYCHSNLKLKTYLTFFSSACHRVIKITPN